MSQEKRPLKDGCYECAATVHVKNGEAVVVLHSTFGLPDGSQVPLQRKDATMTVESLQSNIAELFNGHTII